MKKLIALLLAGCMMATMVVGCGSKEEAAEAPAVTEEAAEAVESDLAYVKERLGKPGAVGRVAELVLKIAREKR